MTITTRVRRRPERAARRRARAFGESLREWLHDRELAALKRQEERAKALRGRARGVDRVPEHLQDQQRPTVWVHEHEPAIGPYGGWVKGAPYRNPKRAEKLAKSGRLRKDLQ